jgi:hypothetical protein
MNSMHRDHAMCYTQSRTIPVTQLTQLQKLSTETFWGTGVLKSLQLRQVLQYKVPSASAQAIEVPGRKE